MARTLNTSHPLFSSLICLIGVEDDGVTLKDFVTPSRVLTPDTATPNPASFGTGTYGAHFRTNRNGYATPRGASISPAISVPAGAASFFFVHNGVAALDGSSNVEARESYLIGNSAGWDATSGGFGAFQVVSVGNVVGVFTSEGGANYNVVGTSPFQTATAASIAGTRTGSDPRRLRAFVNGAQEGADNNAAGPVVGPRTLNKIGGGGGTVGSIDANIVWLVWFNRELTPAEVADLHASLGAGNAFGLFSSGTNGTANGVTLTAGASLIPGTASASSGATAAGVTLTAAASLLYAGGTLQFQAASMEFGARTGLAINTFALDASVNYRYTVHADGLVLGSPLFTSGVVATDSAGKLPNLVNTLIAPGTVYRVVAIRQADGEASSAFRMRALA
jgi:hypothetical protein